LILSSRLSLSSLSLELASSIITFFASISDVKPLIFLLLNSISNDWNSNSLVKESNSLLFLMFLSCSLYFRVKVSDSLISVFLFAIEVSKLANQVTDGSIIIQTYGDIKKGRRTTPKRLKDCFIRPTQESAVPSDLSLVLPYATMKSIIEMIEALDKITPGIAGDHTLLYGAEAKFYSSRFDVDKNFETKIKGLYLGGDGAGYTRGLAQAGANGLKIANSIINKK